MHLSHQLRTQFSDRTAVADDHVELTFDELDQRATAVAVQLSDLGVRRGDVVAVMLPNRHELVVAMFAAWRLGASMTPVNPAFTSTELTHQLSDAGARVLVAERAVDVPSTVTILDVTDLASTTDRDLVPVEVDDDDLALVIYTSGSTGRPKGVMLDHANVEAMSAQLESFMQITQDDHCLLILPLFHVNALMVSTMTVLRAGGRLTIVGSFSASRFFDQVEQHRPTYFAAVPTIYSLLVSLPDDVRPDTSSLRFVSCGAAPVSKELLEACTNRYGFTILEGYGLTEGTCASACNPLDGPRKLGSVGPAIPGQQIAIAGPDGRHVDVGERGEVLISGPTVMRGYLGNPDATASTIIDGWLHTGDVGWLDDDGYLTLVDRIKDMIIRGGENLYPKEIEAEISRLEQVLEVAVVGRPDEVMGEVPVAYVTTYPGATLTAEEVVAHCSAHLMRAKVPVSVQVLEALPKNPVGKIDKPALRRGVLQA
ncbi:MAG: AMP-binding protein [Aeromicrobium erythreum]